MQSLHDRIKARQHGFTLVELVVVIAILGLLAGIIVPTVSNITGTARGSQKEGDRAAVSTAATNYESDNNSQPVDTPATGPAIRDADGDGTIKVDVGSVGVSSPDVSCATLAACFGKINFTSLLNGGYLSELPQHASDADLSVTGQGASTPALTVTGVNKNGDTLELYLASTASDTVAIWNLDSAGTVLILKSDADYGR